MKTRGGFGPEAIGLLLPIIADGIAAIAMFLHHVEIA
jgi:hypothetical protein